jgi:hypothetical protein
VTWSLFREPGYARLFAETLCFSESDRWMMQLCRRPAQEAEPRRKIKSRSAKQSFAANGGKPQGNSRPLASSETKAAINLFEFQIDLN